MSKEAEYVLAKARLVQAKEQLVLKKVEWEAAKSKLLLATTPEEIELCEDAVVNADGEYTNADEWYKISYSSYMVAFSGYSTYLSKFKTNSIDGLVLTLAIDPAISDISQNFGENSLGRNLLKGNVDYLLDFGLADDQLVAIESGSYTIDTGLLATVVSDTLATINAEMREVTEPI